MYCCGMALNLERRCSRRKSATISCSSIAAWWNTRYLISKLMLMPRSDRIYIVVERVSDEVILRRLLPRPLVQLSLFVISEGRSAAVSTARTLLTLSRGPVALVVDADTVDQSRVQVE